MSDYGKLNFAVAFNPTSAFPLDARTHFESMELAVAAAESAGPVGSTETAYHYGMTLTVCENGVVAKYVIQADNTLSREPTMADIPQIVPITEEEYAALLLAGEDDASTYYMIAGDDI